MVEKISSIMSKSFKSSPEAGTGRVCKKNALKNFAIFTVPVLLSLFNKKTPTQVLSCEYFKVCKNTYYEKHLRMAASSSRLKLFFKISSNLEAKPGPSQTSSMDSFVIIVKD